MKKLSYLIIDDDTLQIEHLLSILDKIEEVHCLATSTDPIKGRKLITELQPDIIFLDIEMPELTGIQLIKSLKHTQNVIYITSHLGYAVDAFDVEAIDYIVKPATPDRVMRAIDKVMKSRKPEEESKIASELDFQQDYCFIRNNHSYVKINYQDVNFIEASGNFSFIHTTDGNKQIVLANLTKMIEQLPEHTFIRISRSHIVNKQQVTAINSETLQINEQQLAIGKLFSEKVMKDIIGNSAIKRN